MPYSKTLELPITLQKKLPRHAQKIYLKAFNNAWREYAGASKRRAASSREVTAHKVAWNAVKQAYQKTVSNKWVKK